MSDKRSHDRKRRGRDRLETAAEIIAREPGRGRDALRPTDIPRPGWFDVAVRVWAKIFDDNLLLIAAGVAFYGLLAIFPAITALMSVAGLVYEPADLVSALQGASGVVPPDVSRIILEQANAVAGQESGGLTLGLILGLGFALFSASAGVASLIQGLNVVYGEAETRNFVWLRLQTIFFTLIMIFSVISAAFLIVGVPVALSFLPTAPGVDTAIKLTAYLPLAVIFVGGIIAFYRWGPDRNPARLRWLAPGAALASVLWLVGSIGFSLYVQNFASYNESFGAVAGVIVMLTWMWLSAFIVLLGAALNAEIEAQTAHDSTIGPHEPMGWRGAHKADRVGALR